VGLKTETLKNNGNKATIEIDRHPNKCPYCHHVIVPMVYSILYISERLVTGVYRCSNNECSKIFLGYFEGTGYYYDYSGNSIGSLESVEFTANIQETSPNFVEIYNQAFTAEQFKLHQICGMGYRKALEFLIKDYLIEANPEEEDKIKRTALGNCIKHQVSNPQIKLVASRAVVLGNDETHYIRKYENKDINDLKVLIELTVKWIEMEKLTQHYEQEISDK
jgi:hypothetical protein